MEAKPYKAPAALRGICWRIMWLTGLQWLSTNEKKVRMSSDYSLTPTGATRDVTLGKADYFSSQLTNEIGLCKVVSYDDAQLFSGLDFVVRDRKIVSLADSRAGNHIGISSIALTSDGCLVHQHHDRQQQAPMQLAPSSSGSLDYEDYTYFTSKQADPIFLEDVLVQGIMREMNEEIGATLLDDRSRTFLTGFSRYLHRAGKPEFFGVTLLKQAAHELQASSDCLERRMQKSIIKDLTVESFKKQAVIGALKKFRDEKHQSRLASDSLWLCVEFAIQFLENRNDEPIEAYFGPDQRSAGAT
jgi:hypothetical protein